MGWLLLATLTLLNALAATAVADRARPSGRAELALSATIAWNALTVIPIYGLGWAMRLWAWTLAPLSALLAIAVLFAFGWRGSLAASARALGVAVVSIAVTPFEAIAEAKRARSIVVVPLVACAVLVVYVAVTAYFTPSWRQWDALWYHEPIIGFTLQNHGISVVDIPNDLQKINGYPRLCEMTMLWFVVFTDRRLVDLFPCLVAPALGYATYLLVRRFWRGRVAAIGAACVVLLMPTTAYLLQTTYIDVPTALYVVAATYYATKPRFRVADAWLTIACLTEAVGSKVLALPPAFFVTLIALVRLLRQNGATRASVGAAGGGFVALVGMGASIYWRNWAHFKNPLWPDFQYENPKLGIHLPFVSYNVNPLDMNVPLARLVELLYAIPYSDKNIGPRDLVNTYGFPVEWFILPAAAIALVIVLGSALRDFAGRLLRIDSWRAPEAWNAALVALPMVASVYLSPALWAARYNIANVAVLPCLIAFATRRRRWPVFGEQWIAAAAVASLVAFYWTTPRWWYWPSELIKLARIPYPEREVTEARALSPTLDIHSASAMTTALGLARERDVKAGDVVVFDDRVHWPALLWNDHYSNRLVYVPEGPDFAQKAIDMGARWVFCRNGDPSCDRLRKTPGWRELSPYSVEPGWGSVLERE